jgi:SecD/SecF fusion protein
MKRIIYLFISIVISITLISATQTKSGKTKTVTLQSIGKNTSSGLLKQSADIISTRLKLIGLNSSEVKMIPDKGQVLVVLPAETDISEIEGLLISKGELSFYETYTHSEILDLFKTDNQLLRLLNNQDKSNPSDPRVGCSNSKVSTDGYLHSASPVKNCKLLWGNKSEKSGYCLFALKTNQDGKPLMVRSDIESVKIVSGKDPQDLKIQIKLNPPATTIFADITEKNLNKSIAIVIDDQVFSWPVVRSAINEGKIEVTGTFTKNEVNYFPAVFNSPQLPVDFKLLK